MNKRKLTKQNRGHGYTGQIGKCQRGGGDGHRVREGEGISQRTYMHSRWTQTIVWEMDTDNSEGWIEGGGRRLGGGGQRRGNWGHLQ